MKEFEKLSLAKIVTLKSEAALLFEKYQLDFCCRGKQTLSEAMAGKSEDYIEVKKALNDLFSEAENKVEIKFDEITLTKLIDYILEKHHRFVKEAGPLILGHLNKIVSKHSEIHPELLRINELFIEVEQELRQHMMKEEVVLFPRIKQIEAFAGNKFSEGKIFMIEAPIQVMEAEHENAGNLLKEINLISENYLAPAGACTTYKLTFDELEKFELDLHRHVHLENNILFPKAIELQSKLQNVIFG